MGKLTRDQRLARNGCLVLLVLGILMAFSIYGMVKWVEGLIA